MEKKGLPAVLPTAPAARVVQQQPAATAVAAAAEEMPGWVDG